MDFPSFNRQKGITQRGKCVNPEANHERFKTAAMLGFSLLRDSQRFLTIRGSSSTLRRHFSPFAYFCQV